MKKKNMSFCDFDDLPNFSVAGFTLNSEERAAIKTALKLKQEKENMPSSITLWGKILAIQRDYWIAQAPLESKGNLFDRKFYYSIDQVNWLQLPDVTPSEMEAIEKITKKFTGDPAFEFSTAASSENEGEIPAESSAEAASNPVIVNEEKRLAGVVLNINYDVQVVPRGAYFRDATLKLDRNPLFTGLKQNDINQLTSYFHFREGFNINSRTLAERAANFDETIDIFETIAKDEPQGCWSLQVERGGHVAILRSLVWPGYTFFHSPSPNKFGCMYHGWGMKNNNIGFML